jgi:glycine/D-amino acid oxidase-like deaminating enzyme
VATLRLRQPIVASPSDRSFWLQDIDADAATEALEGETRADVAIVGGGFTGLWTALHIRALAPETRVVVLEADLCGSGASGRNGGQVHSWYAELDQISAVVGVEEARQLCADTADSITELDELQRQGSIDMDLRLDGWLWTASSIAQEGAWARAVAMAEAVGAKRFRLLTAEEIEQRTGSSASYAGVVESNAGTVHPAKLAMGLRKLVISRGVVIHERSPVLDIIPGKTCRLRTGCGAVKAEKVVLAANAWLSALPEHVPVFDRLHRYPNIFYGMGFNGTGIAQTPVGGRILASLVLERKDRWSSSGLVGIDRRLSLPPEPFRYLGAKLVRMAIRRGNDAEIRNTTPDIVTRFVSGFTPGKRKIQNQ